jgi:hypothetical protein
MVMLPVEWFLRVFIMAFGAISTVFASIPVDAREGLGFPDIGLAQSSSIIIVLSGLGNLAVGKVVK